MSDRPMAYGHARPTRAKSNLPLIVLFTCCVLTLMYGLGG